MEFDHLAWDRAFGHLELHSFAIDSQGALLGRACNKGRRTQRAGSCQRNGTQKAVTIPIDCVLSLVC
eukprot:78042-Amphidinium_carterae.1